MNIGLTGYKRSGKSEVAKMLTWPEDAEHVSREQLSGPHFVRRPFAHVLKKMLQAAGLVERETDGDWKERPSELFGV